MSAAEKKVRIARVSVGHIWYASKVGEVFPVIPYGHDYMVSAGPYRSRLILPKDCDPVTEGAEPAQETVP